MQIIDNIHRYPMFAVGTLVFLSVGVVATVCARRIHQYAIQWHERHPAISRVVPFRRHVYSDMALFEVRLSGILSFFVGVFCCWALWVGK